jgi:hypothetical protein
MGVKRIPPVFQVAGTLRVPSAAARGACLLLLPVSSQDRSLRCRPMGTEWFYTSGGRQKGPVDETQLKQLAEAGALRPEDLIWNATMKDWRPAGEAIDWQFGRAPQVAAVAGPPAQTLAYAAQSDEQLVLSPRLIDLLGRTAPWVRFLGVLSYILAGLWFVAGIMMVVMTSSRAMPGGAGAGLGAMYVVLTIVYVFLGGYLNSYASRIRMLKRMKRNVDLEEAIDVQRAFWKFCGITTIVCIGLYLLFVAGLMLFAILGK